MQPPSSGPDPYYPPTTGVPASGYPSYPADPADPAGAPAAGAPAAGGYGAGAFGGPGAYGGSGGPSAYGAPPQTTSFAAPGTGTPQPGAYGAPPPPARKGLIPLLVGIVVALIVVGVGMFTAGYLTGKNRAEAAAATAPSASAPSASAAAPSAQPEGVAGKWTGTYTCAQGETGLTLTITGPDSGLKATFEFYPTTGSGEKGSYTMGGSLVDGSLRLIGVEWLDQPAGYGMVNISSTNVTATTITGKVEADGCTEFSVTRA